MSLSGEICTCRYLWVVSTFSCLNSTWEERTGLCNCVVPTYLFVNQKYFLVMFSTVFSTTGHCISLVISSQFVLFTASHKRLNFREAFHAKKHAPKITNLKGSCRKLRPGPIRVLSEHFLVITQSVLLKSPCPPICLCRQPHPPLSPFGYQVPV